MHLRFKVLPKVVYFLVHVSLLSPLLAFNWHFLKSDLWFTSAFVVVSLLTYYFYLKVALSDPGYINSLMFNKAYANNETEMS
jgi:hypothetical protein